jgi:hypothetical protein
MQAAHILMAAPVLVALAKPRLLDKLAQYMAVVVVVVVTMPHATKPAIIQHPVAQERW